MNIKGLPGISDDKESTWDSPSGPLVKILVCTSTAGVTDLALLGKLKIPHAAQWTKEN